MIKTLAFKLIIKIKDYTFTNPIIPTKPKLRDVQLTT